MFITKVPKSLPPHLSQQEGNRLVEAPDNITLWGIRDRAILEILYGTAVRVSELVGLDVSGWNQNTRRAMATILPLGPGQLNLAPLEVTTVCLNVPLRTMYTSLVANSSN
jgi:site-specific recombinase XerC